MIRYEAYVWNQTQPGWTLYNQCSEMADALLAYLQHGQSFKWYFWRFEKVGVMKYKPGTPQPISTLFEETHHHVVAAVPIGEDEPQKFAGIPPVNPAPPMILDPFHGPGSGPWPVTLETFAQFAQSWPYREPDNGAAYDPTLYWSDGYGTTPPTGGPR